jgi:thioredoxin 2
MAPLFDNAARQFEPALRFAKVDTDAEQELAARYGIQTIPTMILLHGGRELARHSGAMPASALQAWIKQQLH